MIENIVSYLDNLWFGYSALVTMIGVQVLYVYGTPPFAIEFVVRFLGRFTAKPADKPDDYYARRLQLGEASDW